MPSTPAISESSSVPSSTHDPLIPQNHLVYEFASFHLDPANRQLCFEGKDVPLPGRAFDALLLLVSRPGKLVTKEEMLSTVWQDSFVEEANLTVAISTLRRALNEDPHDRRYIQTVARRGYRFIAEVREFEPAPRPTAPRHAGSLATPLAEAAQIADASATKQRQGSTARRWMAATVLLLFASALAAGSWFLLKPHSPIRSLAVLPFAHESSQGAASQVSPASASSDEVVLLGISDGIISQLNSQLVVRPTSSVLRYSMGGTVDAVAAGREQDVDAVLTGVFDTSAKDATLHLRLVRVRDGLVLWQNQFSGAITNLPVLEKAAAQSVVSELRHLGAISAPAPVAAPVPTNDAAYQFYLRGRYFWNRRTVDGLHKSADYFKQSIAANPNYAPAYAGLADSYALLASFSVEPGSAANADARSAALSAIQLDPTLAEPHASLGMIYFFTDWNLSTAEREFERSIQLNPNYATAHHWYALDLAAMGRFPQALYEIHIAQKLDPLSLIIGTNVGWIEYLSHDNTAAMVALNRVLELDPHFARAHTRLGMVQMADGDNAAAVASLTAALADDSGDPDPYVQGLLGDAEARAGDRAEATRILAQLSANSTVRYVPPISRALVLTGLGRNTEAIAALSQAVDDHSTSMVYARVDPSLDSLRTESAFQNLVARTKL
jgi:DNA-binding winged helix-turn-helix (wHTH) protein/Flp pilus assembly protein TadD/TolB-like protein